jgi:muramidase (phage lysozyme)
MSARAVAVFVGLAAFGGVAWALTRSARNGPVDGINWDTLPYDFIDTAEVTVNQFQQTIDQATTPPTSAEIVAANRAAFLGMIRSAEGTDRQDDPYRVVFGYGHIVQDLSDHPYFTGEWKGAPFGAGNWSTAAGAYQFIRGTWSDLRAKLRLPDFGPASQDAAALELVRQRGALADVDAGRFETAVHKVRRVWASLPGAGYGQGERSMDWVMARYLEQGGYLA